MCHGVGRLEQLVSHPRRSRFRSSAPPFVGRTAELRLLLRGLNNAARGNGRLMIISGAVGLGKTRLAEEFAVRARKRGAWVAIGRCWHNGDAPPLWPWTTILRELGAPDDVLGAHAADPHDRFARFVAVLEYLRLVARSAPIVIVLDDAHMADPASVLLTRFLIRERRGLRALFVLTCRDDVKHGSTRAVLAEMEREAEWIELSGLTPAAVRAYLTGFGIRDMTTEHVTVVEALTRGNPLHLRSVAIRSGLDGGILGGLERAIAALVAQLAPGDRNIIGSAAVLGLDVELFELARLVDVGPTEVSDGLSRARALGLVETSDPSRVVFVHELVRQTALAALSESERLNAHARATAVLTGSDPRRIVRRTNHALAAAARSISDAEAAIRIAREAAGILRSVDGFEVAADVLSRAADIHATLPSTTPGAALAVERAEAILACGRLADARPLFWRAAQFADAEGDASSLARAALGLGGVWLREHRMTDDTARVEALQHRALAALPPGADVLRVRLTARLAVERAFRGGPVEPVRAAVDEARRVGDPHALAEALSLHHHALLTPDHNRARLAIAEELIAVAARAGDSVLTLMGLCWRTTDLFLVGDPRAEAAFGELRLRADALGCGSVLFIVRAMDVMRLIRAGRLAEAEAQASECYRFGGEVGDADALAFYGGHLAAIRFFQGREAELAEMAASIAASPTLIAERERTFMLVAALFALRAGRSERAHAVLAELADKGIETLPPASGWLPSMAAVVEIASALSHPTVAEAAYKALLPFADLPIMGSLAVVCLGSTHRALGLAALTCGEHDRAVEHLSAAVIADARAGHLPATIRDRAELGLALIRRDGAADVARGRALVDQAITAAEAAEMTPMTARWREALDAGRGARRRIAEALAEVAPAEHHGYWRVRIDDEVAIVSDRIGVRYLARLVATPDRPISALALVMNTCGETANTLRQNVLDRAALADLRKRITYLRNQPTLNAEEEEELEVLTNELGCALGLGGRARTFANAPERARTAVRKAVTRAIEHIADINPVIGNHFACHVSTGFDCCYRSTAPGVSRESKQGCSTAEAARTTRHD
jgi:AAA ATPase-like protein